jgi:hypothetical protein
MRTLLCLFVVAALTACGPKEAASTSGEDTTLATTTTTGLTDGTTALPCNTGTNCTIDPSFDTYGCAFNAPDCPTFPGTTSTPSTTDETFGTGCAVETVGCTSFDPSSSSGTETDTGTGTDTDSSGTTFDPCGLLVETAGCTDISGGDTSPFTTG